MIRAEYDDRCWHELPFNELADEAEALASRQGDGELADLTRGLRHSMTPMQAELVIHRIEVAHRFEWPSIRVA